MNHETEVNTIMDYVRSAALKGKTEMNDIGFIWDLDGVFLQFVIDIRETTVFYLNRKKRIFNDGHFHIDNPDVISLIEEINNKDKIIHITYFSFGGSFEIVDKSVKRKKSRFIFRHFYSSL